MNHLLAYLLLLSVSAHASKFPSNWKKCPTKDNNDCLKVAVEEAIHDLKDGNKKLHVTPLDPLHFERLELNQGGSSPVNINLTFYDLDLIGASRVRVNNATFDMDKHELELNMTVTEGDTLLMGDYTISGSILVLPIRGKGKANITFEDLNLTLKLLGDEKTKNGKGYFHADKSIFHLHPKKVHFWFANLFDGVPQLGDNMNRFLNDNWKEIMGELSGTIAEAMGQAMMQVANNFFDVMPMDQMHS